MEGTELLARDATKHLIVHRKPRITENSPDQDVNIERKLTHFFPRFLNGKTAGHTEIQACSRKLDKPGALTPLFPQLHSQERWRKKTGPEDGPPPRLVARSGKEGMKHGDEDF